MYADTLLAELEQEAQTTRRVLERLPNEHLDWRPAPLEAALETARDYLRGLTAESADRPWRLTENGREIFTVPKAVLLRTLLFNHWYHHRGQLSVYYRCLGVPVPAIYGRSADEKLFGA